MGQKYLIDSNVLIDYMADLIPAKGSDFVESLFNSQFLVSVVTKIKVLGYNNLPHKMSAMSNFVSLSNIAATAIADSLVLITRNVDDFKFIPNFTVINPYEI